MKNIPFLFLLLFAAAMPVQAQQGCDIRIKINGLNYDTLWFGTTYGKRPMPQFYGLRGADGFYHLKNEAPLPEGMYAFLHKRSAAASFQFLSVWLVDGQRQFTIETGLNRSGTVTTVTGSPENELLYQYLGRYEVLNSALEDRAKSWKEAQDEPSFRAYLKVEEELARFQADFIEKNPGTRTAELVRQTQHLLPPGDHEKYADWQAEAEDRHRWHRSHFFYNMDLGSGDFLKYPLWVDRTDFYFSKLPPPVPDSMIVMIEDILVRLEPDEEGQRYYLRYILNSISKMSRYRTDEVYVHFVRKYLDGGKADWLGEEAIKKYREDADRMEPLFVGKKVPNVNFYDKKGQVESIYGIDAPFTLLVFWLFDCSHCKREMPVIIRLYEKYKGKGLKVMSVCGKSGDVDTLKCWEFAEQMKMPADWLVVNDPNRRSRFSTLLNVRSYPRMILLDANKNIVFKQNGEVPEEMLERELDKIMD